MSAEIPPELRVLRDLFTTTDPVPSHLVEAGYAAPGLVRDRDDAAVRLELVSDSADMSSSTRLCGQRGRTGSRVLTFMMPGRIVEIDLVRSAARTLRATGIVISRAGQGVPAGLVAVRYPGGQCAGELDGSTTVR